MVLHSPSPQVPSLVTMSAPTAPSAFGEMAFVPQDLVMIEVSRYSASVYPKVESSMPVYQRTHAFQVAQTALEPLPVDMRLILDAFGAQLNCSAIVDGLIFDWKNCFDEHWCNFANLTIQSFHNLTGAGAVINNTIIAADPTILVPMQNGATANCRKPAVQFVHVLSSIDFAPLVTIAHAGPTFLCLQYYLELPQSTLPLLDRVWVNYNLTTWHGRADLLTLSAPDVQLLILDVVLQDRPIALLQADFNLSEVKSGFMRRSSSWVSSRLPTLSSRNFALITAISLMLHWTIFNNLALAQMANR